MKIGTNLYPSYPECCQMSIDSIWKTKPPKKSSSHSSSESFVNYQEIKPWYYSKEYDKSIQDLDFYWCNHGTTCRKYRINKQEPWNNSCGNIDISGTPAPIYLSKDQCFNNDNRCTNLSERSCSKYFDCGWCVDSKGKGKCVEGTGDGPLNINKYPYCTPQYSQYSTAQQNKKYRNANANRYIHGYSDPYFSDKIDQKDLYRNKLKKKSNDPYFTYY
jgi:hypothetical protein